MYSLKVYTFWWAIIELFYAAERETARILGASALISSIELSYICISMRCLGHSRFEAPWSGEIADSTLPLSWSLGLLRSRLTPLNLGDRSTQNGMASLKATNAMKRGGVVNHCPLDLPGPWH